MTSLSYRAQRAHQVIVERIAKLGLSEHPGLLFKIGLEGYRDYAFGSRSGPVLDVSSLFHEFAHATEFGPDRFDTRCTEHGFTFNVKERWVYDRYCVEPETMQAVARELRTFGYQFHLMRLAGYRITAELFSATNAPVMRFMPDWYCVPGEKDEGRIAFCEQQILSYIKQFDAQEAFSRFTGWLDHTVKRLERASGPKNTKADDGVPRYRANGSLYDRN